MMPGIDGFEVCRRIRADPLLADVPVVMTTALDDKASRLEGIEAGADDFISKPIDRMEIRARVNTIIRLNRYRKLMKQQADLLQAHGELQDAYEATLKGWVRALDFRDNETGDHSRRVTLLTVELARLMGMSDSELIHVRRSALLHDIGKIGVPDHILHKPGPLTEDEWVIMRKHPQFAHDMLAPIEYLRSALDIPFCHHERWDGTGYPRGLKGEQIPLIARIFAVVDVWDALSSDRPYRKAWSYEKIVEHMRQQSGTHFDPKAVELFLQMMGDSPPSTTQT
jgi:putative two-component system response regulator